MEWAVCGQINLGIILFLSSFFVLLPHHKSVTTLIFIPLQNLFVCTGHSPFLYIHPWLYLVALWTPKCLVHKRCPLCELWGSVHTLSFKVLCGIIASLAFFLLQPVFSLLCHFETSRVLFSVIIISLKVCPVVKTTAHHLSVSCVIGLFGALLDLSRCLIPKTQLSFLFFIVVHLPARWWEYLHHYGHIFHTRILMGMTIHPGIDKIVRTWCWGSTPKEESVLGSQYRVGCL